ncbi:FeoB-associated Cys-rich membrane protein [Flagellatimonas centrodinii]|uniref:FeoB-associated Cys-rich membrane protein n=1 Tax=Flagellatimonas centrodinii TaxID=2806210 RepID=UPI001FFAAC31|nr:FeoB-associated Cys-rich membrane protein [Flagellatimonas centrodinii]ULQ46341.1 FeoB-associated Cys-rich membrane protein [Flagellatimonas centrodinii]
MSYALLELAVVTLVVSGAAGYALWRWWPRRKAAAGCDTGCASCNGCAAPAASDTPAPPTEHRVKFHR